MAIETGAKYAENLILLEKAQSGDEHATEELMRRNAGLVQSIAVKFCGRGTEFEDLVQIGNIGMLKAIRSFDAARGCVFAILLISALKGWFGLTNVAKGIGRK